MWNLTCSMHSFKMTDLIYLVAAANVRVWRKAERVEFKVPCMHSFNMISVIYLQLPRRMSMFGVK